MAVSETQIKQSALKEWNKFVQAFRLKEQTEDSIGKRVQNEEMEAYAYAFCVLCDLLHTEEDEAWAYVYPFEVVDTLTF